MVDYEHGPMLSFTPPLLILRRMLLLLHTYLHFYSDIQYLRPISLEIRQTLVSLCHDTIDEQGASQQ